MRIHRGSEINSMELLHVGGKAKGLSFLLRNELRTPDFYVIDFEAVQQLMQDAALLKNALAAWEIENQISQNDLWAVRSSAADEDGREKSLAGQYTTVLNLEKDELADGIMKVIGSYSRETKYAGKANAFGVVIQKMLNPDFSGVFFSKDPILHYSDQPVISLIPGIGDKLVSGEFDGFHIHFEKGIPIFDGKEDIDGEIFREGKRCNVKRSKKELIEAITPHIKPMIAVADRLEKVENCALDFEFLIQNGELFWLQIRPITTRVLNPLVHVWDNTSVEANFPGITLPLSISFISKFYFQAYFEAAKSLGFGDEVLRENKRSLANMAGTIKGVLYYNISAWQALIYQMPFGAILCKKLPGIWGMEDVPLQKPKVSNTAFDKLRIVANILGRLLNNKKYEREYQIMIHRHIECFDAKIIQNESIEQLINRCLGIEKDLGNKWLAPVLNGFNTMIIYILLKRTLRHSKIAADYPNFINDILSAEGDVKSVRLVSEFQEIMKAVYNSKDLRQLFVEEDGEIIWLKLPSQFGDFYNKVCAYIKEFGSRAEQGELKLETINYKQNPVLFMQFIQANLKGFRPVEKPAINFNYKEVVRKYYRINVISRWWLNKLVLSTIKRVKARENYRFMRTDTFAVIRILVLQMGKLLQTDGFIDSERDVLYLEMDELFNPALRIKFKTIIADRKQAYLNYGKGDRINRYIQVKDKYFAIHTNEIELEGNELKGIACCSGVVTSRVMIINADSDFDQDFTNYILVAEYFEPGWINLFYQAKGVISERGNLLSHTAIICRELGLPSIIGARGILKKIKNSVTITMDGERGIIKIHEDE